MTDDGRGIDAESLEQIFSPHLTTKATEAPWASVCRCAGRWPRRFGGELSARSVAGWLSSFRLSLPIAES